MREQIEGGGRFGKRERTLLVVLGVVGLAALLFIVLGGDDGARAPTQPRRRPTGSPAPKEPADRKPPPETDDSFAGRDPFQPLVAADLGPPADEGDGAEPGDSGVANDGDGGEARRVTLLDIFEEDGERMATIEVDGDEFTAAEGETFAESFRVLSLTTKCGTFVFGDERFTLCLGQEVLK